MARYDSHIQQCQFFLIIIFVSHTFEDPDIDWGVERHELVDHWKAGGIIQLPNAEQNLKLKREREERSILILIQALRTSIVGLA
jgi:hypothetical protein